MMQSSLVFLVSLAIRCPLIQSVTITRRPYGYLMCQMLNKRIDAAKNFTFDPHQLSCMVSNDTEKSIDTIVTMIPEKPPPDKTAVNSSEVARNNKTAESLSEVVKKTKSPNTQKVKQTHSKPNTSRSPTKMNTPRDIEQSPQRKKSSKSAPKSQKGKPVTPYTSLSPTKMNTPRDKKQNQQTKKSIKSAPKPQKVPGGPHVTSACPVIMSERPTRRQKSRHAVSARRKEELRSCNKHIPSRPLFRDENGQDVLEGDLVKIITTDGPVLAVCYGYVCFFQHKITHRLITVQWSQMIRRKYPIIKVEYDWGNCPCTSRLERKDVYHLTSMGTPPMELIPFKLFVKITHVQEYKPFECGFCIKV